MNGAEQRPEKETTAVRPLLGGRSFQVGFEMN